MFSAILSHFNDVVTAEQGKDHISFNLKTLDGQGAASVYSVFPGIEIGNLVFQTTHLNPLKHTQMNIVEINHCKEGRAECKMNDGCFQYIGEGDLFMNTLNNYSDSIELPLGYYHGIMILIDIDRAAPIISELFPNIPMSIQVLSERFFDQDQCFLIQEKTEIQHIFSGMYTIPASARLLYYRLKIQELLLYLYFFLPSKEKQKKTYPQQQVEIIKQIQKRITSEPEHRFTIEGLAREYCISPTALKSNFKGVYGVPIATYMKKYRIQQATILLQQTQLSMADIAAKIGYESQSKFGAAFKEIMKITPLEYRRKFGYTSKNF
ncbi:MAG: AraC family transcriptional regulator [Thermotaleaceae bacterium]